MTTWRARTKLHAALATAALAVAVVASSGGCDLVTLADYPCPPGGTTLTYANFGEAFLAEWCNGCHSAPDGQRNGAPDDVTFATLADVVAHKDRIFARAADTNDSMPTGPNMIPDAQRVDLANWLACGPN